MFSNSSLIIKIPSEIKYFEKKTVQLASFVIPNHRRKSGTPYIQYSLYKVTSLMININGIMNVICFIAKNSLDLVIYSHTFTKFN